MELNTVSLGDFVRLAAIIFEKVKDDLPTPARDSGLFRIMPIPENTGNTRDFTEIDLQEYARRKNEGEQAQRAKVQQGYNVTMRKYRIALDIGITYEMRKENKYPEVISRLTNLGTLADNRMDLDLTHRITFMTSTSYTDMDGVSVSISLGDGLALASTAHTVRGSSSTYRNRLANNPQFSRGALEGMEQLVAEQTINQFGEKVVVPFDVIWSTEDPNTVNSIREFLTSTASPEPGVNANVTNVYKGKYRHVIFPRIATDATGAVDTTKRKYWGLASTMFSQAHLGIWENPRLKLPPSTNPEDAATDNWDFGVRAGYGIVIVSGAWFKASTGDGTP